MTEKDRRRFRRLRVRLAVEAKDGPWPGGLAEGLWTVNVSSGGMYVHVPAGEAAESSGEPQPPGELTFELRIPAGDGHAAEASVVRGAARVVRADTVDESLTGLALQFTRQLSLSQAAQVH